MAVILLLVPNCVIAHLATGKASTNETVRRVKPLRDERGRTMRIVNFTRIQVRISVKISTS